MYDAWDPSHVLCVSIAASFPWLSTFPQLYSQAALPWVGFHGPASILAISSDTAVFSSSLKGCTESGFTPYSPATWTLIITRFISLLLLTQPLPSGFIIYRWIPRRKANCTWRRYFRLVKLTSSTHLNLFNHFIFKKLNIFYTYTTGASAFRELAVSRWKLLAYVNICQMWLRFHLHFALLYTHSVHQRWNKWGMDVKPQA